MVKFIHTADWQIGMKAAHVGAVGQGVREARLDSAKRVVQVANQRQADFMIVAGDTFEDNAVDRLLVQRVADILSAFTGSVYIISGNHDPLVSGSVWEHPAWAAHSNLYVVAEAQSIELEAVTLYPCPLLAKYSTEDPTAWIDASSNAKISVGIGHGTVQGIVQGELDYPIPRDAATRSGLDYLGIGHWHSYASYPVADGAIRLAYSGTHETTKFGERDSGNVLLVEIPARGEPPIIESIPTGSLQWTVLQQTLTEAGDAANVVMKLEKLPDAEKTLVDLRLDGVLHREDRATIERIEELLEARFLFGRLDISRLAPSPADDAWLDAIPGSLMRAVARKLQTLSQPISDLSTDNLRADRSDNSDAADQDSPQIATRALMELYRIVQEANA